VKKIKRLIFLLFAAALIFSCTHTPIRNTSYTQANQEKETCGCVFVNNSFYGIIYIMISPMDSKDTHRIILWPKWLCETENNSEKKWKETLHLVVDKYLIAACFVNSRNMESQAMKEGTKTPTKDKDGWGFEIHFQDPITDNNSCKTPEERKFINEKRI